jgi:opacity protein-like surface antigen
MKKILIASAVAMLSLTAAALASDVLEEMPYVTPTVIPSTDLYFGIEGGYGMTNWKTFANNTQFTKDSGIVSRVFLGYDFSKYWAVEFGYTHFFNTAKKTIDNSNYNEMKTQVVDLVGKLKVPANDDTNFYAKFGVDYLITTVNKTGNNLLLMGEKTWHEFDIAYGIGVDYSINPNVVINLEWMRHGSKILVSDEHIQPYTDAFMAGIRYKFDI